MALHPEVESLHTAPMPPAHRWVQAGPNAPQGGCAAQLGQKIRVLLLLKKKRESEEVIFVILPMHKTNSFIWSSTLFKAKCV